MFKLDNGAFTVHLLSDGVVKVDSGGPFGLVPRVLWSRYQTPDENHLVPMCLNCLLVQAHGKNIVIDVGLGSKLTPKMVAQWNLTHPQGTLIEGLARLNLKPEDIDLVINTHLHADHAAGNTIFGEDAHEILPTFPNAEHVVQRREYEDAMRPNERTAATYIPINYEPLAKTGQMRLLEEDTEILPGIWGVVTPGHTPGHMSVVLDSGGDHLLFACDLASYAIHFERLGWMTAYDVEPLVTLETKRNWQQWAWETNGIIIFPHDVTMLAARLSQDEAGKPKLVPVTEAEGARYS
jgi:glyoxylase-like metal-dependent hydrolase (beta-lactamase superfamily II)